MLLIRWGFLTFHFYEHASQDKVKKCDSCVARKSLNTCNLKHFPFVLLRSTGRFVWSSTNITVFLHMRNMDWHTVHRNPWPSCGDRTSVVLNLQHYMKVSDYVVSRPLEKREFSTLWNGLLSRHQSRSGTDGEGKTLMSLPRIEPRVSGILGRNYIDWAKVSAIAIVDYEFS
jgi:hypothetical protein